jgi:hypothetical protein
MTDKNHERDDQRERSSESDALEGALDALLAKYSAVDPRAGLEERILANLRAEQMRVPERAWWRWSIAATVAAVIVVGITLAWRADKPAQPLIVKHPSSTQQSPKQAPQIAARDENGGIKSVVAPTGRTVHHSQATTLAVASENPKLDVFPSPQPLSEQEKILMSYVTDFHDEAVVIARVTNEELQRDRMEILGNTSAASSEESAGTENTNR